MTGQELAARLKEPLADIHKSMSQTIRKSVVAQVEAGEWFTTESGIRDRIYKLISRPKRIAPNASAAKKIRINRNNPVHDEERRQIMEAAAARRRRLIRAGLYITSSDLQG